MVIGIFGCQVMICLEIMSNGDLRSYLRSIDMRLVSEHLLSLLPTLARISDTLVSMDYLSFLVYCKYKRNCIL